MFLAYRRRSALPVYSCLALAALAVPASILPASAGDAAPGIEFELGGGGRFAPVYEGAADYLLSPYPTFRLKRLTLPNGFQIGGGDGMGLSFYPSFSFHGARKAADTPELTGLEDVDSAVELGAGVGYATPRFKAFAEVRRGFGGHDGHVGEFGADFVAYPTDRLSVSAGPRVSFADSGYMNAYFGVSDSEAKASGLSAFDAGAGFKSVGVEASARYALLDSWAVETSAGYDRLIGDAARSPVTGIGSRHQYSFSLGLVRQFQIDF